MKIALKVDNVFQQFGSKKVLGAVNLEIPVGQIVALVGPSGCGKTTLLKAILGTDPPSSGTIYANDKEVTRPCRDVGIVYQEYGLYDFLTARNNVAFGPKLDKTNLPYRIFRQIKWRQQYREMLREADEYLDRVCLKDAGDKYPNQLSGGMRQRVALAQALIMKPQVLLLDEPFAALDEATREELQMLLLELHRRNLEEHGSLPYTILIVTHALTEALFVSDRVIGLSQYHPRGAELGATIVYDKPSPIFRPLQPGECEGFFVQKEEMRRVIFEPDSDNGDGKYVTPPVMVEANS